VISVDILSEFNIPENTTYIIEKKAVWGVFTTKWAQVRRSWLRA
jgi:hypothetical protein